MNMKRTLITNGKIIGLEGIIPNGSVSVSDGVLTGIFPGNQRRPEKDEIVIDAQGNYISPGFVDLHVHGGGGYDFLGADESQIHDICKIHMKHGTTSIVPTVMAAPHDLFLETIKQITKSSPTLINGPNVVGIHLEGPYFALSQCGAQSADAIRNPDRQEYMDIVEHFNNILIWSVAPELPGALEMARELAPRGIRMSIGHSDALFEEAVLAYEYGYERVTHLYSCTSTVRRVHAYRKAGIIEAAFLLDDMIVETIADGRHLPPSLLKLIYKIKGPDRICLVTDASCVTGLTGITGEIPKFKQPGTIIIEDDVAKLPDRSAFAGSVATTDRLVRTMVNEADVPLFQAVKMMSATPAKNIGVFGKKGSLAIGKDADILIFDANIKINTVIVGGSITFRDQ
jgi:N-acetylglucosamine-6-phosphate deacetylase